MTFTDINADLTGVSRSSIAIGDFDGQNGLDLFISGLESNNTTSGKIYLNDGSGGFTEDTSAIIDGGQWTSVATGDFDGQNGLDLVVTGHIMPGVIEISKIYLNDGSGSFTEDTSANLTGVTNGTVLAEDFDGDNDLDLFITGRTVGLDPNTAISKIYLNDGNGGFTESPSANNLPGVTSANSVVAGDFDGQNGLDLLITGSISSGDKIAKIYLNNGSGGFTEDTSVNLTGVDSSLVATGDFDGDNDLDLLITGNSSSGPIAQIYLNDGSGGFTEDTSANLTGVYASSVVTRDFDGQNGLDLLITGLDNSNNQNTKIYLNDGSGAFIEDTSANLTDVSHGSVAAGDFDGDADPDLVITGVNSSNGVIAEIYRNDFVANSDPVANNDTGTTDEDTVLTVTVPGVLANDSDPDSDPLTVTDFDATSAKGAIVTVNADGSFTYDPNDQFEALNNGQTDTDTFTYTIDDGNGGTDTATVTVTINGVNDPSIECLHARSWGDPHLVTFDGYKYDFQAPGEFMLVEELGAGQDNLQIQVRQKLWGSSNSISVNTAVATELNGQAVEFDLEKPEPLLIDGVPTAIADGSTLTVGNDEISRSGNKYTFTYAGENGIIDLTDDSLVVTVHSSYLDLDVCLCDVGEREIQGLFGNADGNSDNDLTLRTGTLIAQPPSPGDLYTEYASSWRITQPESLFSSPTFTDPNFTGTPITLGELDPAELATAQATVEGAGIFEEPARTNAIIDLAITGDLAVIESALATVNNESQPPSLQGTSEDDYIEGTAANEIITGIGGSDFLIGGAGHDLIEGGDGVDLIEAGAGNDIIDGGADDDVMFGDAGHDRMIGSSGDDFFLGGEGEDTADYSNLGEAITYDAQSIVDKGSAGIDEIFEVETIIGAIGFANEIDGSTGVNDANSFEVDLTADSLIVDDGETTVEYTIENFVDVTGTPNDDSVTGNDADNTFEGRGGADLFIGSLGNDTFNGGGGQDTADYAPLDTAITFDAQTEVDKGTNGLDQVSFVETIIGALGQANEIDGSTGVNDANFFIVDLTADSLIVDDGVAPITYTIVNFVDVIGTPNDDSVTGNDADNTFLGRGGADLFIGSLGNDTFNGGGGQDTADYANLDAAITFDAQTEVDKGVNGLDEVSAIETIIGALGQANTIDGSTAANNGNSLSIDLSNNSLIVDDGETTTEYTVENFVNASGNDQDDEIIGNDEDNLLIGLAGSDSLYGGAGADTFIGVDAASATPGAGERDQIWGGAGADTFVLGDAANVYYLDDNDPFGRISQAIIRDFGSGVDKLQLSGVADDYVTKGSFIYADLGSVDGVLDPGDDLIAYAQGGFDAATDFVFV